MDVNVKRDAGLTDENEYDLPKPGIENEILGKKRTQKSYMQPTISAASKAVASKKKILGERNDDTESVSSETFLRKSQIIESKTGKAGAASEKGVQPYDPFTNYLSPRPKFLRYNPDRLKGVIRRREEEGKDGTDLSDSLNSEGGSDEDGSSVGGPGSLASSPRDNLVKVECENMDDRYEGIEDVKEERGWGFKCVLKCFVLLAVLVMSTLYVSSMNSPTPSPAVRVINDGCYCIQRHFLKAVDSFRSGEVVPGESAGKFDGLMKLGHDEHEGVLEDMNLRGERTHDASNGVATAELYVHEEAIDTVEDNDLGAHEDLNEETADRECEQNNAGAVILEEVKFPDQQRYVTGLESCSFETDTAWTPEADEFNHQESVHDAQSAFVEENEAVIEVDGEVFSAATENGDVGINECEEMENVIKEADQIIYHKALNLEILNKDVDENSKWKITGDIMNYISGNTMIVFILSLGFLILVALVLGYQTMRKRNAVKKAYSLPSEPCAKSLETEKCSLEIEKKEETKDVDTFVGKENEHNIQSRSEVYEYEEFSKREAPSVGLLGEFVFEDASSLVRCNTKIPGMEVQKENRQPVSSECMSRTISHMEVHTELDSSEFSTVSSPSYGSFTAEKKIVKTEDCRSGEVKKVITTPVRRSSRIRNRALVSPSDSNFSEAIKSNS